MTVSVLERHDASDANSSGMAELNAAVGRVDDERLPCRNNNPELWFADVPTDVEYAKALCRDCPVLQPCLRGALDRAEPWGVWGGELFQQGVVIPRKRPRGRPRKESAS